MIDPEVRRFYSGTPFDKRMPSMASLEQKMIKAELIQRREEGCQLENIEPRINEALERKASDEEFFELYEELIALPVSESSSYIEPSALDEIRAQRPNGPRQLECNLNDDQLYDRIYGGWLGRAAGCALGKPVEVRYAASIPTPAPIITSPETSNL